MSEISNWISDSSEKTQAQKTQKLLDRLKHERYSSEKRYRIEKTSDFPATYREIRLPDVDVSCEEKIVQ